MTFYLSLSFGADLLLALLARLVCSGWSFSNVAAVADGSSGGSLTIIVVTRCSCLCLLSANDLIVILHGQLDCWFLHNCTVRHPFSPVHSLGRGLRALADVASVDGDVELTLLARVARQPLLYFPFGFYLPILLFGPLGPLTLFFHGGWRDI